MPISSRPMKILSAILVAAGALFLVSSVIPGLYFNLAWPAVFFVLSALFFILLSYLRGRSLWLGLLHIPAALTMASGLLFLYNTITQDWNAWAYAWLLLVAVLGLGVVLAAREGVQAGRWDPRLPRIGFWVGLAAFLLFVVLALIIGGPGLRAAAALLVIGGGVLLWWTISRGALPDRLTSALIDYAVLPEPPRQSAAPLGQPPLSNGVSAGNSVSAVTSVPAANSVLVEPLSERELEVLRLINLGLSNSEIAVRLVVAQSTVKTHINNLYAKLGVKTRVQALNRAKELGLME